MHLDAQNPQAIQEYLTRRGWISEEESVVAAEKPGEGNMNYTLRVRTSRLEDDRTTVNRSLIVKQSRGYVEKYPSIAAPADRAVIEGQFYRKTGRVPALSARQPELLDLDADNHILVMEDLGASRDFTDLYAPGVTLTEAEQNALVDYLSTLHNQFRQAEPDPAFANKAMRALNHEHMFRYPFMPDNGFDLNGIGAGLQEAAMPYKLNEALKETITQLGRVYLGEVQRGSAPTLLHGDYYPGSWLRLQQADANGVSVRVIDPEFCFYGPAEFDLGVMLAHLHMSEQPTSQIDAVLAQYARPDGFDENLLRQFTGVEIMRRLIGLAQLPLSLSLETKVALLDRAAHLLH
ncbi:phosphotransferase [Rudanella paleaurantiibacter]|uniref:Phosphotransferase n=1 Tax=Rudanella paleaurantiibacter TaxID=2614655 RepID=A0A7J5TZ73_9BACT|nr:phosphotransferase [Rudanella paleaurantiibacter]KAB7730448.1 phosphotransferase [Rudanella paleaurantiibacter]